MHGDCFMAGPYFASTIVVPASNKLAINRILVIIYTLCSSSKLGRCLNHSDDIRMKVAPTGAGPAASGAQETIHGCAHFAPFERTPAHPDGRSARTPRPWSSPSRIGACERALEMLFLLAQIFGVVEPGAEQQFA